MLATVHTPKHRALAATTVAPTVKSLPPRGRGTTEWWKEPSVVKGSYIQSDLLYCRLLPQSPTAPAPSRREPFGNRTLLWCIEKHGICRVFSLFLIVFTFSPCLQAYIRRSTERWRQRRWRPRGWRTKRQRECQRGRRRCQSRQSRSQRP